MEGKGGKVGGWKKRKDRRERKEGRMKQGGKETKDERGRRMKQ